MRYPSPPRRSFRQSCARLARCAVLGASLSLLLACDRTPGSGTAPGDSAATPFVTDLPMHDLMAHVLDPAADIIWGSSGEIVTAAGTESLVPTDDDGWHQVEFGAATLIEAANLLMLPGRAPDTKDWQEFALGLATMGQRAMAAAEAQDGDALFAAGADLYQVCLACHQQYDREMENTPAAGQ